jgi:DnaJ-class molecular chaperone
MSETEQPQPCPGHVVPCGSCKGSGKQMGLKCDVCKGVGSVLLK